MRGDPSARYNYRLERSVDAVSSNELLSALDAVTARKGDPRVTLDELHTELALRRYLSDDDIVPIDVLSIRVSMLIVIDVLTGFCDGKVGVVRRNHGPFQLLPRS